MTKTSLTPKMATDIIMSMSYLDQDDDILATVTGIVRHDQSMAVLSAYTDDDQEVTFACELRYAVDIVEALHCGEEPRVAIAPWMVLG